MKNNRTKKVHLSCLLLTLLLDAVASFQITNTRPGIRRIAHNNPKPLNPTRFENLYSRMSLASDVDADASILPPNSSTQHHVQIEYCTGCRWLLRSTWLMQELLTTFDEELGLVTLVPSKPPSPGGTFVSLMGRSFQIVWEHCKNRHTYVV